MAMDLEKALGGGSKEADAMFTSLATELKSFTDQAWNRSRIEAILKGLRFEHIRERESRVESAHQATFHWVFDPNSPVNLATWLREGSGTYWIEGKAGSGKSTLMKHLLQHDETTRLLQQWAQAGGPQRDLFIGSHFFWSMGTDLQKSQTGLLRTMLFQLLKRHPDLIQVACPDRLSTKDYEHLESWTMESLIRSFKRLMVHSLPIRMCFFIDGLDEYRGIHTDLVDLLSTFAASHSIKLCVSSRPWPEFRDAYGASPSRLCIHEFTREDIRAFALGRLSKNPRFEALRGGDSGEEANLLIKDITSRAEGVFLWVYYVVRSLLRGLSNRDDIRVLRKRLDEFPRELTDFFKHMFNDIDPVYKSQAATFLKMLAAYDQPLPVLTLIALEPESIRVALANWEESTVLERMTMTELTQHAAPLRFQLTRSSLETERHLINDRCRDLLHAVDVCGTSSCTTIGFWDIRIGFLHRTVSDFISTSEMELVLAPHLAPGFHPRVYHLFALSYISCVYRSSLAALQPPEYTDDVARCFRSNMMDFFRLATFIHAEENDDTIVRAKLALATLDSFWTDASKFEGFVDWFEERAEFPEQVGIPSDTILFPGNLWTLLGSLGLTRYITARSWPCQVPNDTMKGLGQMDPDLQFERAANSFMRGAFWRRAVLNFQAEGFVVVQYIERWNTEALVGLFRWLTASKVSFRAIASCANSFWGDFMIRVWKEGCPVEAGTSRWQSTLDMARILLTNGAERMILLPREEVPESVVFSKAKLTAWKDQHGKQNVLSRLPKDRDGARIWAPISVRPEFLERMEGSLGTHYALDSVHLLEGIFGKKEARELGRLFWEKQTSQNVTLASMMGGVENHQVPTTLNMATFRLHPPE